MSVEEIMDEYRHLSDGKCIKEETAFEECGVSEFKVEDGKLISVDENKNIKLENQPLEFSKCCTEVKSTSVVELLHKPYDNFATVHGNDAQDVILGLNSEPFTNDNQDSKLFFRIAAGLTKRDDNVIVDQKEAVFNQDCNNAIIKEEIKIKQEPDEVDENDHNETERILDNLDHSDIIKKEAVCENIVEVKEKQRTTKFKYSFTYCNSLLKLKRELNSHISVVNEESAPSTNIYQCEVCKESFTLKIELRHHYAAYHENYKFVKRKSQTNCSRYNNLQDHTKIPHQLLTELNCGFCPETFNKELDLNNHLLLHKRVFKEFVCYECGKGFGFASNLSRHARIHSGEKPFDCKQCGKGYSRLDSLKKHQLSHTKQFSCTQCDKSFSRFECLKVHLNLHKEVMLDNTNGRCDVETNSCREDFTCNDCGYRFKSKQPLQEHMKTHDNIRPYRCDTCNQTFKHRYTMDQHILSHSEVRAFICVICKKGFKRKAFLKQHMLVHTKEKKYACDLCSKRYYKSCHLKYHKEKAHN